MKEIKEVCGQVIRQVLDEIRIKASDKVWDQVRIKIGDKIRGQVTRQVYNHLKSSL